MDLIEAVITALSAPEAAQIATTKLMENKPVFFMGNFSSEITNQHQCLILRLD